jgi:hypothetical protein
MPSTSSTRVRAQDQFLGTAARRDQTHADFDETHIRFSSRLDPIGMQADLAAAADRQPCRRDDNRHRRVLDGRRRRLEGADHRVDLIPVPLLGFHQEKREIRTGREWVVFVADDERRKIARRTVDTRANHRNRVGADRVHL